MTSLASKLLNAYSSKINMKWALEEKTEEPVNVPLSGYAEIVRSLEKDTTTMEDIEGTRVKKAKIPYGTTKIGPFAFAYNLNLELVIVPKTVIECDPTAFIGSNGTYLHAPVIFKDMDFLNPYLVIEYTTSGQADGTYISTDANGVSWQYSVTNEMATITKLSTGCPHDLEIPPFFGDTPVRSIGDGALSGQTMYSVVIPHTITCLNPYSIYECPNLSAIDIPNSIVYLHQRCFSNCGNLQSAFVPNSITSFGVQVFYDCTSLSHVVLEEDLSSIGYNAFVNCDLTSVTIPNKVVDRLYSTFVLNKNLVSLVAPSLTSMLGSGPIVGCTSLKTLYIPNVKELGLAFGYNQTHVTDEYKLSSLQSLDLPSIEGISANAFGRSYSQQYTAITELNIPNKTYSEIIKMDNYNKWYLQADCRIHARDRVFYYDLSLNTYNY